MSDYGSQYSGTGRGRRNNRQWRREEVFTKRVPAGRRTYFFDVMPTRSGHDYFIVITESKRVEEHRYQKHKLRLYKEDFAKFVRGLHETVDHVRREFLPDFEFHGMPDLDVPDDPEKDTRRSG